MLRRGRHDPEVPNDQDRTGSGAQDCPGDASEEEPPDGTGSAASHHDHLSADSAGGFYDRDSGLSDDDLAVHRAGGKTGVADSPGEPRERGRSVGPSLHGLSGARAAARHVGGAVTRGIENVGDLQGSVKSLAEEACPGQHTDGEVGLIDCSQDAARSSRWRLASDQDGHRGGCEQALGSGAQPSARMLADNDDIGLQLVRRRENLVGRAALPDRDRARDRVSSEEFAGTGIHTGLRLLARKVNPLAVRVRGTAQEFRRPLHVEHVNDVQVRT